MGSKKTSSTETKDPWAPAQPALNQALSGAMEAFNTTYNGPGVAGMDPLVTEGQNAAIANARTGALGNLGLGAVSNLQGVMGNGGLSQMQTGAAGNIGQALQGFNQNMSKAQDYLNPYASGQYLQQTNPYFEQAVGNAMQKASEVANRQFSGAGRYGSGAHSGVLGDTLGKISTDAYANEYARQQQNQLSAIGQMGNFATAGLQGNLTGEGQLAGIGQQGISNTGAIAGAIPQLGQAMNADASTLMGIGGQRMDYNQALIDAANQNPWAKAQNLAEIASTIGSLGGKATKTTKESGGTAGIVGGVLGGLGGLGNLAKGLGGLGSFSSLFALSDERAKEDIKRVGKTDDGQNIYTYRYKSGGPMQMGLMAQEVMKRKPEAVARHESGLLMVDYAKATAKKKEAA